MPESVSSRLQVDFPAVQTRLNAEEEAVVMETIRNSPTWSQGEQQRAFEQEFTRYVGCAESLAVSSCTSALEMAAALCGLAPEDEVILPAHTFVSSAVPFARTGARLVFCDNMISFPFWSDMPEETLRYMADSVCSAVQRLRTG